MAAIPTQDEASVQTLEWLTTQLNGGDAPPDVLDETARRRGDRRRSHDNTTDEAE